LLPGNGDGPDLYFLAHPGENFREPGIGVVVGKEEPGFGPMDNKENPCLFPPFCQMRQFQEMAPSPLGDGVGEHGDLLAEEGARLHLQQELALLSLQQKVEAASTNDNLPARHAVFFQARDEAAVDKSGSHRIGQ
jgi:hypothetical protein